jgi:hypothetical protein
MSKPVAALVAVPGKAGKKSMFDLGHVLPRLSLMTLERDGAVYVKAAWYIVFFYECLLEHVGDIVKELLERKELDKDIVTLTVGKREGKWFTLGGAKTLLGMVQYQMTRREWAELLEEFARLEKHRAGAGVGAEAGAKPAALEPVKLEDGQESVIKMRQEEGKDEDGDGWLDVRIVWLG